MAVPSRIAKVAHQRLADMEQVFAGRAFPRIGQLQSGRLRPAAHVRPDARAVADELQHFALAHAVEQLLRLDDGAGAGGAANVEHGIGRDAPVLALADVVPGSALRQFLGLEDLDVGVLGPGEQVVPGPRAVGYQQHHLAREQLVEHSLRAQHRPRAGGAPHVEGDVRFRSAVLAMPASESVDARLSIYLRSMMRNLPATRERGAAQLRHLRCPPRGRLRDVHLPAEDARVLPLGERAAVHAVAAQGRIGRMARDARADVGPTSRRRNSQPLPLGERRARSVRRRAPPTASCCRRAASTAPATGAFRSRCSSWAGCCASRSAPASRS